MASKVLVTGGSGLVGFAIREAVKEWEAGSDRVIDLSGRVQGAAKDNEFVFLSSKDGDLRDPNAVQAIFEKHRPAAVVHLAARVGGVFANMTDQIGFLRDNLAMNDNVVRCCHDFGVKRAVFCLSTCVYPAQSELPYTEEMIHNGPPHHTNEGYAHSKRILECLVRFYRNKYNHEWVCIIPTNLYGLNDNFHLEDSHVIPGLMHKCLLAERNKTEFTISGTGTPYRQFLYSRDAGRIILALLRAPKDLLDFSSVILCGDNDQEFTIKYVAEQIVKAMSFEGSLSWDSTKSDGIAKKTASNAVLRKFLGNNFKFTPLEDGLDETATWFKASFDAPVAPWDMSVRK